MRKLVTFIDLLGAMMGAVGTAVFMLLGEFLGFGPVLNFAFSLFGCILLEDKGVELLHSEKVREKRSRQVLVALGIMAFFLFMWVGLGLLFHHDLLEDLQEELIFAVVLPIIGTIINILIRYIKTIRIQRKFKDGSDGVQPVEMPQEDARNRPIKDIVDNEELTVATRTGRFEGTREGKVKRYLGIPYAQSPVGALRWKAPQPLADSDQLYEAKHFGLSPIQTVDSKLSAPYTQGEDCLNLNIWLNPAKEDAKKPVLVLLPGGDFSYGSAAYPLYDGAAFVADHPEALFVSVNSRCGAMGYIDFSGVPGGEAFPDTRNLGLLDQIAALEWLRENIAAFGGDPDNITLVGNNAGATSALLLSLCPKAKGLFRKVILLSIALPFLAKGAETSRALGTALAKNLNCPDMTALMAVPEARLAQATQELRDLMAYPVLGSDLLPADVCEAIAQGMTGEIQFLTGTALDETGAWIMSAGSEEANLWFHQYLDGAGLDGKTICWEHDVTPIDLFEEYFYRAPLRRVNHALAQAGKPAHSFIWEIGSPVERFGANTVSCVGSLLGNAQTAEQLGFLLNDTASEVLQAMVMKFLMDQPLSLYEDELHGMPAIDWSIRDGETATFLCFEESKVSCRPLNRKGPAEGLFDEETI